MPLIPFPLSFLSNANRVPGRNLLFTTLILLPGIMSVTEMKQSTFDARYNYCKRHQTNLIRVNVTQNGESCIGREEEYSPGYFHSWSRNGEKWTL